MEKLQLSERDICTRFITPAIQQAGWQQHQFREEVNITQGRVMVRGKLAARIKNPEAKGGPKRADYVLYARPNLPIAVIEAKPARFSVGHGMQQALGYAEMLDAPFALSSNGEGFLLHDRTSLTQPVERALQLDAFPTLDELWLVYQQWKGLAEPEAVKLIEQPFHTDGSGKEPRYHQRVAINRAIEAIAKGQQRVLLVMATGTGKTYTAFQIIWRGTRLRDSIKGVSDSKQRKPVEDEIEMLRPQAEGLRLQARDAQAAGDRLYWPIFNLDLKNPNAPEEESHDPDVLLEKYKILLGQIEETESRLKSELAAALAHYFTAEEPQA